MPIRFSSNDKHFIQHIRHTPALTNDSWRLIIDGYVDAPLTLSLADLHAMPTAQDTIVMTCAGHKPDAPMVSQATWQGVALNRLLNRARVHHTAQWLNVHSADGYSTALPMSLAPAILLAHTMNGEPLPAEHGYPLRVIINGRQGYKQPKWITHIQPSDKPITGFWEQRGLSQDGEASPLVTIQADKQRIPLGERVQFSGIASGGTTWPKFVLLQIEGGQMLQVPLERVPLPSWTMHWQPSESGLFRITARTMNYTGDVQSVDSAASVVVEVVG